MITKQLRSSQRFGPQLVLQARSHCLRQRRFFLPWRCNASKRRNDFKFRRSLIETEVGRFCIFYVVNYWTPVYIELASLDIDPCRTKNALQRTHAWKCAVRWFRGRVYDNRLQIGTDALSLYLIGGCMDARAVLTANFTAGCPYSLVLLSSSRRVCCS